MKTIEELSIIDYKKNYTFLNTIFDEQGLAKIILDYKFQLEGYQCCICKRIKLTVCKNCKLRKEIHICISCCKGNIYKFSL
jgi:hypothetical protein